MRASNVIGEIDFSGQTAIVTGGASGIGREICDTFAALGANVAVADIEQGPAEEAASELEADHGVEAIPVETDVSSYDAVTEMVETVDEAFGRIDSLVNNAGIGESKPFTETEPDLWEKIVGVCFYGTMNCTHAVLPHMIDQGDGGAIVNFASDSYKGNDPGLAVYGAAKAANVSLTRTVAHEVGDHGVRVNCLSPGTTKTPATADWIDEYEDRILESYALDRIGEPADHADAVAFLCSDAADWVTGEVLSVNGGYIRG
ncbi:SDR family NAD(P)-dependent oxidoreductase [Halomarina halobia]|uniref:SDR family NAD(P)-dependent oxidoreductase n=1 Tax=Halomarina halobia TaxID=3033386 RepID=A0ABD6AEJ5_9EURY|nr:glucose 1-dehydrogenase [Halomarina sp. PSR21]